VPRWAMMESTSVRPSGAACRTYEPYCRFTALGANSTKRCWQGDGRKAALCNSAIAHSRTSIVFGLSFPLRSSTYNRTMLGLTGRAEPGVAAQGVRFCKVGERNERAKIRAKPALPMRRFPVADVRHAPVIRHADKMMKLYRKCILRLNQHEPVRPRRASRSGSNSIFAVPTKCAPIAAKVCGAVMRGVASL
jgi:hypothetical protein